MKLNSQQKRKQFLSKLKYIVVPVIAYGGVAGIFTGFIVSLFNLCANFLSGKSSEIYAYVAEHPAFIPLLFAGLIVLALAMYAIHKACPHVRGSGMVQAEGVMRGLVTLKWLRTLIATITGSFISFFAGLSLGSEGPSVQIGAMTAQGASELMGSRPARKRYITTGGASAGLAVAFNAPLTGIIFALEEAHRRFTPMILMTASSSVISGTITYRLLSTLWGAGDKVLFDMGYITPIATADSWMLLILGVVCGATAIFFNFALVRTQRFTDKIEKKFPYWLRLILVFVLTGVTGLVLSDVNGGGHGLIIKIANLDFTWQMLILLLAVKLIMIIFCYNSGATGGLFIPMLAIGALVGGLCGKLFIAMGLDEVYYKAIVCIAMTTFFGASVRAPITAIVLIVEITGYSAGFLSSAIAIFSAYMVAELLGNRPIYDSMLARFVQIQNKGTTIKTVTFEVQIELGAFLVGKSVSDILWPANCLVKSLTRGEEHIVPDGETLIEVGDILNIEVETNNPKKSYAYIKDLVA